MDAALLVVGIRLLWPIAVLWVSLILLAVSAGWLGGFLSRKAWKKAIVKVVMIAAEGRDAAAQSGWRWSRRTTGRTGALVFLLIMTTGALVIAYWRYRDHTTPRPGNVAFGFVEGAHDISAVCVTPDLRWAVWVQADIFPVEGVEPDVIVDLSKSSRDRVFLLEAQTYFTHAGDLFHSDARGPRFSRIWIADRGVLTVHVPNPPSKRWEGTMYDAFIRLENLRFRLIRRDLKKKVIPIRTEIEDMEFKATRLGWMPG